MANKQGTSDNNIVNGFSLEMISDAPVAPTSQLNKAAWLSGIWRSLITALTGNPEPQIWQRTDRSGHTWWHVYDPTTGRRADLNCEAEVRTWLDQRYYR